MQLCFFVLFEPQFIGLPFYLAPKSFKKKIFCLKYQDFGGRDVRIKTCTQFHFFLETKTTVKGYFFKGLNPQGKGKRKKGEEMTQYFMTWEERQAITNVAKL